jgi:DNA-directed RNA polymerase specialized sigma subunit
VRKEGKVVQRKITAQTAKDIRDYVSAHKNLKQVYILLANRHQCSWRRVREVADPKYGVMVRVANRKRHVKKVFEKKKHLLTDQQQKVVKLRLYDNFMLKDVGKKIGGLTRERARQIFNSALRKMKIRDWQGNAYRYKSILNSNERG